MRKLVTLGAVAAVGAGLAAGAHAGPAATDTDGNVSVLDVALSPPVAGSRANPVGATLTFHEFFGNRKGAVLPRVTKTTIRLPPGTAQQRPPLPEVRPARPARRGWKEALRPGLPDRLGHGGGRRPAGGRGATRGEARRVQRRAPGRQALPDPARDCGRGRQRGEGRARLPDKRLDSRIAPTADWNATGPVRHHEGRRHDPRDDHRASRGSARAGELHRDPARLPARDVALELYPGLRGGREPDGLRYRSVHSAVIAPARRCVA